MVKIIVAIRNNQHYVERTTKQLANLKEQLVILRDTGLTQISQCLALLDVIEVGGETVRLVNIALTMRSTNVAACNALTTFKKLNLVDRKRDDSDRRICRVPLTDKAKIIAKSLILAGKNKGVHNE